jgi:hypothetical protein
MKGKISDFKSRCEHSLRRACGRIGPNRRVAVVVGLCSIFAVVNVWMLIGAATDLGRGDGHRALDVDHIEATGLDAASCPDPVYSTDSLNTSGHERTEE